MCGPSSAEKSVQAQSQSFSNLLQAHYGTLFGQQQGVLNAINRSISPILAAGPNQRGFSAEESAALNTQAINSAGAANRNARQAAANFAAGEGGGGTSGLTSGIQRQINASIASGSANELANAQNQITQADFNQGNANFWRAQGGANALAAGYNPNSAASDTIGEQGQAFSQAHTINQENNQKWQTIAGAVTGLAGGFLTGGLSNLGAGESFGEGAGDFFKGGLSALGGH